MILDELVLHNFGVYRGRQRITLTPPSPKRSIVLFGGLNGGGKTTLLDALQLALYGKLARCSNRGTLGYDEFLKQCVNRSVGSSEGAAVELQFRFVVDGTEHTYRVHRSWVVSDNGVRERLEVLHDGKADPLLTEHWAEHIDALLPMRLSQLFFFDGERVEALANVENSAQIVSTAVHGLLGLDLVDQLATDLTVLERRKRSSMVESNDQHHIATLEAEVERLDERYAALQQQRASVQNALDRADKRLAECEERFRMEGGASYEQRTLIEESRRTKESELESNEEKLRHLAEGAIPLLVLKDLLNGVVERDRLEEQSENSERLLSLLSDRDAALLSHLHTLRPSRSVANGIENFLASDRTRRATAGLEAILLKLDTESRQQIRSLAETAAPQLRDRAEELLDAAERHRRDLDQIDRRLASVPDEDAIGAVIEAREGARQTVSTVRARLASVDAELEQLKRERDHRAGRLAAELDKIVNARFHDEDNRRVVTHSERARATLQMFRRSVVERHLASIEQLVLESFQNLLRKASLVGTLRIDPSTFALELRRPDGSVLSPDRLSAGERQLLAVSMLWGLAKASARPLPTVIDTPLGRLDASHRHHLITKYFPHASHQVLLLSTDEEINEGHFQALRPSIGHVYRLAFNDQDSSTTVEPGYFW